ncbi:MAG: sigma-54 dependent transcriptional regulator [Terrimicrobiaceae bacterium]|nr:sigma-54 dependent transcriptional regulator [Terrimicrobiaceae bacterium]
MDPSKIHILVLDRDPDAARAIRDSLKPAGYQVSVASDEREAVALAEEKLFNLVIKSFDAHRIDAVALMDKIRKVTPDTQFIFAGERGTIRTAVDSIRKGAFDYLSKPIEPGQLIESITKALDYQALVAEDQRLKVRLRKRSEPDIFAGKSAAMQEINALIQQIGPTDVTVLIEGESGTGKEIVARAIHEKSRRRGRPFIAVNCAALPDNLIEAELFGHVRGAFTGAIGDRDGRFQLAHGGTLFLDEIGDLSAKGQGDLLRVLEDGIFRPVGSHKIERADARIVAASNKNLEAEGINGRFREDLFYRLNIVTIQIPPLRERAEDIPTLVNSFAEHFCAKHRRRQKKFSREVVALFQTLRWPGNVRQLRNTIERLVVTIPSSRIGLEDLPAALIHSAKPGQAFAIQPGMALAQVEAELIRQTLLKVTSNRAEAAARLGISRRALQYKIARYGLDRLPKTQTARTRRGAASPPLKAGE